MAERKICQPPDFMGDHLDTSNFLNTCRTYLLGLCRVESGVLGFRSGVRRTQVRASAKLLTNALRHRRCPLLAEDRVGGDPKSRPEGDRPEYGVRSTEVGGRRSEVRWCESERVLRLGVERRGEDERDRQERRAGLCAARLELGSTGRAGDKNVLREVSTERNTWGLTWRQEVETRVSRWRSKLVKYMGKQWALRTIT